MTKSENPNPGVACGRPRSGRSDRGVGICEQAAGWGTDHLGWGACRKHGGNTPSGKTYAARQEAEWIRRQFMVDPDPVSPEEALEQVLAASFALFNDLRRQLAEAGSLDAASARVLDLFAAERDRVERSAKAAGALSQGDRQIRLAEQQGVLMHKVFEAVVRSPVLGLSAEQRVRALQVVRHELANVMAIDVVGRELPAPGGPAGEIEEAEVVEM